MDGLSQHYPSFPCCKRVLDPSGPSTAHRVPLDALKTLGGGQCGSIQSQWSVFVHFPCKVFSHSTLWATGDMLASAGDGKWS